MHDSIIQDQQFKGIDYTESPLPKGEYENCQFSNCNFSNSDLSEIVFVECEFHHCDLSMSKLSKTAFREVEFNQSKLLGLHFEDCNEFLFEVRFSACLLNLSSFFNRKLKNTRFTNCKLHEVDFVNADLSHTTFADCDLLGATFDQSNLEKADLSTAFNYIIDPESNRIKKAKFSSSGLIGLLQRYDIEVKG